MLDRVHTLRAAAFSFAALFFRFLFYFITGLKFLCISFAALVVAQLCFFFLPFIDFQAIFFSFLFFSVCVPFDSRTELSVSVSFSLCGIYYCVLLCRRRKKPWKLQSVCSAELHDRVEILLLLLYRKSFLETKCGLFLFFLAGGISIGGMVVVFMLLLLHL